MKALITVIFVILMISGCEKPAPDVCKTCVTITTVFNPSDTTTVISDPFILCGERLRVMDNLVTRITSEDHAENTLVEVTVCDYVK